METNISGLELAVAPHWLNDENDICNGSGLVTFFASVVLAFLLWVRVLLCNFIVAAC